MRETMSPLEVSDEQSRFFDQHGYVKFSGVIGGQVLASAQASYRRMLKKVEDGKYPFFRIYDDYRKFNVAGIEHIFHPEIFEPQLLEAVVHSGLLSISSQLLKTNQPAMILNRIHCTTEYSHTGTWHRDAGPNEDSHLQLALYLFDEKSLWAIPGSHRRSETDEEARAINGRIRANFPGQVHLGGNAGDLLLFKSSILHRAASAQPRAQVHFRFGKNPEHRNIQEHKKEWFNRPEILQHCDSLWRTMLTETMVDGKDNTSSNRESRDRTLSAELRRLRNTVLHHALFAFSEDSRVFQRSFTAAPNLRLKEIFGLNWK